MEFVLIEEAGTDVVDKLERVGSLNVLFEVEAFNVVLLPLGELKLVVAFMLPVNEPEVVFKPV